jgi:hypothetical protein
MRRFGVIALGIVAVLALSTTAFAGSGMASGSGKLHDGGTFGFTVKSDLTGSIEYQSPDGLKVHCDGIWWYREHTNAKGYPDVAAKSNTCVTQGPERQAVTVWIDVQDRGEPGTYDRASIIVKILPTVRLAYEHGRIQSGNVQVQP